jgi:uncharacterized iron-regulated protein
VANPASLSTLVSEADPDLGRRVSGALDASLAKAQAFPATFEAMIAAPSGSPANRAMEETIEAVEAQSERLEEAAEALGVKVSFES